MKTFELTSSRPGHEHEQEPSDGLQINDNVMSCNQNKTSCTSGSCKPGEAGTSSDDDSLDNPFERKSTQDSTGNSLSSADIAVSNRQSGISESSQPGYIETCGRQKQFAEYITGEHAGNPTHDISENTAWTTPGLEDVAFELPNEKVIAKAANESPEFPLPAERLSLDSFKV
jgi:hypothetical protein